MPEVVWALPFPSSGLSAVHFQQLAGRRCSLTCDNGENSPVRLAFEGVEAFKCTYHNACTLEMVETYDRLTDLGRLGGSILSGGNCPAPAKTPNRYAT